MSLNPEVDRLMTKLTSNTGAGTDPGDRYAHYMLPEVDSTPYKSAGAWPGKEYILLGNSFNLESTTELEQKQRAASLAKTFADNACMTVSELLNRPVFLTYLSRFERDWLQRMPEDTVLTPAFNANGVPVPQAFAVWRTATKLERARGQGLLKAV